MTNQFQSLSRAESRDPNDKKNYNLTERTSNFGVEIIIFVKAIKENNINKSIISQLIRSATSIGANYMEADCAESKKDFNHKISICKKEAKETTHWLYMLATAEPNKKEKCRQLWKEAHELTLIFSAIVKRKY
ncbi:four helix bundle protein [Candidatus Kuenenbacteria bacterium]|nr:four helix bundle protein [Candidatus Kuenenbacteria bacterium]